MSPLVKAPSSEPIPVLNCSFKVYASNENKTLLRELRIMAAKDGASFSEIIRSALGEYYEKHKPGNPQLILGHWNGGMPLPQTVTGHKHKWRAVSYEKERWFDCDCGAQRA